MKPEPRILYEDDCLIVVEKPSGVLTIPDRFDASKPNLLAILQEMVGPIWVVHRLDRETSGLICFAKNESAHRHLNIQFTER
ncbi:MAG: pseudouridine synthase, partial [Haliscomenobacter sp.]